MPSRIIFLCCLCSACVSTETYPDNWPTQQAVALECADISGVYNDEGNSAYDQRTGNHVDDYALSTIFFGEGPNNNAYAIAISQSTVGKIIVKALIDGRIVRSRTLSLDDDFECEDGRVWLPDNSSWFFEELPGLPAVGKENIRLGFSKAVDDSLVAQHQWSATGAWAIVPFAFKEADYILWTVWPLDSRAP